MVDGSVVAAAINTERHATRFLGMVIISLLLLWLWQGPTNNNIRSTTQRSGNAPMIDPESPPERKKFTDGAARGEPVIDEGLKPTSTTPPAARNDDTADTTTPKKPKKGTSGTTTTASPYPRPTSKRNAEEIEDADAGERSRLRQTDDDGGGDDAYVSDRDWESIPARWVMQREEAHIVDCDFTPKMCHDFCWDPAEHHQFPRRVPPTTKQACEDECDCPYPACVWLPDSFTSNSSTVSNSAPTTTVDPTTTAAPTQQGSAETDPTLEQLTPAPPKKPPSGAGIRISKRLQPGRCVKNFYALPKTPRRLDRYFEGKCIIDPIEPESNGNFWRPTPDEEDFPGNVAPEELSDSEKRRLRRKKKAARNASSSAEGQDLGILPGASKQSKKFAPTKRDYMYGWLFSQWRPMQRVSIFESDNPNAECVERISIGPTHAAHDSRFFRATNLCIPPHGAPFALGPKQVHTYVGPMETTKMHKHNENNINGWMHSTRPYQIVSENTDVCFMKDDPWVIVVPILAWGFNPAHVLHRAISTLGLELTLRRMNSSRPILYHYIITTMPFAAREADHGIVYELLYQVMGDRWLASWGWPSSRVEMELVDKVWSAQRLPMEEVGTADDTTASCYREAHVMHMGGEYSYGLWGMRTPNVVKWLNVLRNRLRRCYGLNVTRTVNRRNPQILLVARSFTRRWANMADVLPIAAKHFRARGGRAVRVFEDTFHTRTRDLVKAFTEADIILGPPGSGLWWSFIAPRGALVVEVTSTPDGFCASTRRGFNLATDCDLGGDVWGAGLNHLAVDVEQGWQDLLKETTRITPDDMIRIFDTALCGLRESHLEGDKSWATRCLEHMNGFTNNPSYRKKAPPPQAPVSPPSRATTGTEREEPQPKGADEIIEAPLTNPDGLKFKVPAGFVAVPKANGGVRLVRRPRMSGQ